ncbi:schlafen family protein [Kipferlia bialata]|uniref:Schlafen family protein n=1 Tax=Kipferlia bialata TaxID=797122 RepID=A0A9K3GDY9_9EUKA|nr:schlafen family protein [Kipferlia bialata]|eukprot:g1157.t1
MTSKDGSDWPSSLQYLSLLHREEDMHTEFKAMQVHLQPQGVCDEEEPFVEPIDRVVSHRAKRYINAFLNTNGGTIWCGIDDTGRVLGVPCDQHQRDEIRLSVG